MFIPIFNLHVLHSLIQIGVHAQVAIKVGLLLPESLMVVLEEVRLLIKVAVVEFSRPVQQDGQVHTLARKELGGILVLLTAYLPATEVFPIKPELPAVLIVQPVTPMQNVLEPGIWWMEKCA